jgi:hypothetical protein
VFVTIEAARIAGVKPWELDEQPVFWRAHILEANAIRNTVAKTRAENEQRKRVRQGRRR